MITPEYVAGFFDGEGSIRLRTGFSKETPESIRAEVVLSNTHKPILVSIQQMYGGKLLSQANKHRPIYRLCWRNLDDIYSFLSQIAPHLIIKKRHATLLLEYLSRHNSRMRTKITERDRAILEEISLLNCELRYRASPSE